jgi:hypothetical protein
MNVQLRSTALGAELCDYAALDAAEVSADPFDHLLVTDFVPPAALEAVYADMPRSGRGGSFPPEALALGPAAKMLMREMQGPRLRNAIATKFALDLADAPTMLTVRVACREKDGQIHTDSLAKLVTVLLYLNPDREEFARQDGCLRLLRQPDDLEDYAVEVPPTRGTLLVFPNGPATWHGHRSYAGPRYALQLNYMANDGKARSELRRHKLSAFLKSIVPA